MLINFVKEHPDAKLPVFAEAGSSGADLYAVENTHIFGTWRPPNSPTGGLFPVSVVLLDTGLSIASIRSSNLYTDRLGEQEDTLDIQLRMRSGLAKRGLILLNGVGTIDCSYRGPIKLLVANIAADPIKIEKGDRIGQLVLGVRVSTDNIAFRFVDRSEVEQTERGTGGFGSTGR